MQPMQPLPVVQPAPSYRAGAPGRSTFTPSDLLAVAAGILIVVASFLTWVDMSALRDELTRAGQATTGVENLNAWGKGLFPAVTLIALAGLLVAVEGATSGLGAGSLPAFLRLSKAQFRVAVALPALLLNLAYWVMNISVDGLQANLQPTRGLGFYLSVAGCVGALAAGVLAGRESQAAPARWMPGSASTGPYGPNTPYGTAAGASPFGTAPAVTPPFGPSPVVGGYGPVNGVPVGPAAAGGGAPAARVNGTGTLEAPAVEEFWFYVEAPQPLEAIDGSRRVVNVLQPGEWFLAKGGDGVWIVAVDDHGNQGRVAAGAVRRQS